MTSQEGSASASCARLLASNIVPSSTLRNDTPPWFVLHKEQAVEHMKRVFNGSHQCYGAEKIAAVLKKEGRKTAVKLFDTQEEAEAKIAELGKGHYLEVRKGESMKCKNYCLCSGFCNFCQQNLVNNEDADDVTKAA